MRRFADREVTSGESGYIIPYDQIPDPVTDETISGTGKPDAPLTTNVATVAALPANPSEGDRIRLSRDVVYQRPIVMHVGQGNNFRGYFDSAPPTADIGSLDPGVSNIGALFVAQNNYHTCLLYTSPSPRD